MAPIVIEVHITGHILSGHQEEEEARTAHPISLIWASHIANSMLMGASTLPSQPYSIGVQLVFSVSPLYCSRSGIWMVKSLPLLGRLGIWGLCLIRSVEIQQKLDNFFVATHPCKWEPDGKIILSTSTSFWTMIDHPNVEWVSLLYFFIPTHTKLASFSFHLYWQTPHQFVTSCETTWGQLQRHQ